MLAAIAILAVAFVATTAFAADSGGISTSGDEGDSRRSETSPIAQSDGGEFPIRARKVEWGDGLGAGRGHQGQDLLTKCGKPVVAAQAGRVQVRDRHSAAGNYVVIDGKGKRRDAVYMHLLRKATVRKGQRVRAGQEIGRVGRTGRASACHLHFELWGGKGWYEGGSPVDPRPPLRKWRHAQLRRYR